jgi:hypothetical protein
MLGLACIVAGTLLGGVVLGVLALLRSQRASASAPIEIGPTAVPAAPARTLEAEAEATASPSAPVSVEKPRSVADLRAQRPAAPAASAPPPPELASAAPSAAPSAEPSAAPAATRSKGPVPVMDPGF